MSPRFRPAAPERPILPPPLWRRLTGELATNWVAGWYVLTGLVALLGATGPLALSGWAVGGPFGLGQLGVALVFQAARRSGGSP